MDRFLAALNKLQDVFTTSGVSCKDIDLPQIVVVGSQSAGKSSVLEAIAKQDFLPRGMGIVTRRPLVLQMIQESVGREVGGVMADSWVKFLHAGDDKVFTDMKEVQKEIIADTDRVCGKNEGISDAPIHVKLHSTKIPSLTLIDLPGLTKIAVGDQPKDIDKNIEALVRSYIEKQHSIILAVSPGNMDIANSDSLKLAMEVDPEGSRTLGVITKCDLMEINRDARELLGGRTLNMKLGLIGVINRNNEMLTQGISLEHVQDIEDQFFREEFPDIADKMGTKQLSSQLCDILIGHLKKCLPDVSDKIVKLQDVHRTALQNLGEETTDPRLTLLTIISKFTDSLNKSVDGQFTYSEQSKTKESKTNKSDDNVISAGAELFKVFNIEATQRLSLIPADQGLVNIKKEIANTGGIQPSLFVPDNVFNRLILKQLDLLRNPALEAIEKCHSCIAKSIEKVAEIVLMKYPKLQLEVVQISKEHLEVQKLKAKTFIEDHLVNESSYINTNHPDFVDRYMVAGDMFNKVSVAEANKVKKSKHPNEQDRNVYMSNSDVVDSSAFGKLMSRYNQGENLAANERADNEAELVLKLIIHYFCIVRGQLLDVLLKSVMRFMVRDLHKELNSLLLKTLYTTDERIAPLVSEPDKIRRKRQSSSKMLSVLKQAENLVSDIAIDC